MFMCGLGSGHKQLFCGSGRRLVRTALWPDRRHAEEICANGGKADTPKGDAKSGVFRKIRRQTRALSRHYLWWVSFIIHRFILLIPKNNNKLLVFLLRSASAIISDGVFVFGFGAVSLLCLLLSFVMFA